MSTEIASINDDRITLTQFWGGSKNGVCLQVTKLRTTDDRINFNGFIQLTPDEASQLAKELAKWVKCL